MKSAKLIPIFKTQTLDLLLIDLSSFLRRKALVSLSTVFVFTFHALRTVQDGAVLVSSDETEGF